MLYLYVITLRGGKQKKNILIHYTNLLIHKGMVSVKFIASLARSIYEYKPNMT